MFTDWILACMHHVAVFSLAAALAAVDLWYGILAGAVIVFGVMRLIWGAKGYEYYLANHIFWTKMGLFLVLGLLSIIPTLRYLAWRRSVTADAAFLPPLADVARIRMYLWLEAGLFLCIPIAAAAMARGYGV
jgi:putative membrane protein